MKQEDKKSYKKLNRSLAAIFVGFGMLMGPAAYFFVRAPEIIKRDYGTSQAIRMIESVKEGVDGHKDSQLESGLNITLEELRKKSLSIKSNPEYIQAREDERENRGYIIPSMIIGTALALYGAVSITKSGSKRKNQK